MRAALALAARGLGSVWPNPAVGCVLAKDGRVVARGWTQRGGRPHAEAEALGRAGAAARGATAYVTLEPCAHHGATPPCAEALVAAGIARAVIALEDPDNRVDGRGLDMLHQAGVEVAVGLCRAEAAEINAGFLMRVTEGRPLVSLKLASTLDGRIATRSGESRWITGEEARARVHLMRARNDAIMVGIGTALADDPELTCRLPGLAGHSPVRVAMDGGLRLSPGSRLAATAAERPTWLITGPKPAPERRPALKELQDLGVEIIEVEADAAGRPDPAAALGALAARGITRLMVEGGATLAASLLGADLVDRIAWFRAPSLIGGDGLAAAAAFGLDRLDAAPRFERRAVEAIGQDLLETYARRA